MKLEAHAQQQHAWHCGDQKYAGVTGNAADMLKPATGAAESVLIAPPPQRLLIGHSCHHSSSSKQAVPTGRWLWLWLALAAAASSGSGGAAANIDKGVCDEDSCRRCGCHSRPAHWRKCLALPAATALAIQDAHLHIRLELTNFLFST